MRLLLWETLSGKRIVEIEGKPLNKEDRAAIAEWQDGTDDMLTNVERVYETRYDCLLERREAA